jgi:beta-barrel assembly-enhancing protease
MNRSRLLIGLVVAVISILGYFGSSVFNPVTQEKQHVAGITPEQEVALGLQAAPEMEQQFGGLDPDNALQQRVSQVGQRLASRSAASSTPYRYEYHVLDDPETINAFALPGGQIFITEGLLRRLQTEGQLAGVLGHETGHVVARHGAEHIAKQQLTAGLTGAAVLATYDPNDPNSRGSAAVAAMIGQLVTMRFGRQDELEADQLGVRLMSESGYDPRSMVDVMKVLEESSQGNRPPEFFSTHPNPENRIARIQEAIKQQYPNGVPAGLER